LNESEKAQLQEMQKERIEIDRKIEEDNTQEKLELNIEKH
jgi:predicted component of type VI protein secretion system